MSAPALLPVFVDACGLAEIDGQIVRVAIGARDNPGSLWAADNPAASVPWRDDQSAEEALEMIAATAQMDGGALTKDQAAKMVRSTGKVGISALNGDTRVFVDLPAWARTLIKPARYKALSGGRGSMKSWTAARHLILDAVQAPQRVLCGREFQSSIRASSHRLIADQIDRLQLSDYFEVLRDEIRVFNEGCFLFYGVESDQNKVRSAEGITRCWIEEADSLSKNSIKVLKPTMRRPGAQTILTWNPQEKNDPVQDFVGDDKPASTVHVHSTYRENPFFSVDQYADVDRDKRRDVDDYEHVWGGQFRVKSSARVFKHFRVEDLDALVEERQLSPRVGADLGFQDPTVIIRAYIIPPKDRSEAPILYIAEEAFKRNLPIDQRAAFFVGSDKRGDVNGNPRWSNKAAHNGVTLSDPRHLIMIDSAEPGCIEQLKKQGLRVEGCKKGAGSVSLGVERIQQYDVVIHPKCTHTEEAFRKFSFVIDKKTGEPIDDFDHEFSHCIDALRYLLDGVARNRFPSVRLIPFQKNREDSKKLESIFGVTWGPRLVVG